MLPWWFSWWRICLQCRRPRFDPWVGKIPWRSHWLPTPVFWPWESHGLFHEVAKSWTQLSDFHFLSLSSFTFIKRLFGSSLLSTIRMVSSAFLRLLLFLSAILIPACASSSLACLMIHSAYKLNKQGENIEDWRTPFPILNQSMVPCPVLTVASWPKYRFFRRQVRWSGIPFSLRIFHSLLWPTQKLLYSQWSRSFSGILLLFLWSSGCWHFDLWFLYLF